MNVKITPSKGKGIVTAPPSKSMAHRLLISAALSTGESTVRNIAMSQDILATLDCVEALGAKYTYDENEMTVHISGIDFKKRTVASLYTRESGSTLRFMIPICMLSDQKTTLSGSETLFKRPLSVYEEIADKNGLLFEKQGNSLTVQGTLPSGTYEIDGSISSQFISGLLFALPLLKEDSVLKLLPPVESVPYIKMTVDALKAFDVKVEYDTENQILFIPGSQKYTAKDVTVEGDFSNAAFLEALNYVGSDVNVTGLSDTSLQGDQIYLKHFPALKNTTPVIDISDCPDLGPILFTLAAECNGATFTGTKRLKIKESDRASAMKEELSKFGCDIEVFENEVIIPKVELHAPNEALNSHNDHRIVMSMATLASKYGGEIIQADAVRKSFPDYFTKLEALGIQVTISNEV